MSVHAFESTTKRIAEYVTSIANNKSVPAAEFVAEGLAIREEVQSVLGTVFPRDPKTGELAHPVLAGLAKTINANPDVVRKEMLDLVYKGDIDPISIYGSLKGILEKQTGVKDILPAIRKDALKDVESAANSCDSCYSCISCTTCAGCLACILTLVEAAAVAETLSTAMAAATAA